MRLLHHYTTNTSQNLPNFFGESDLYDGWSHTCPQIAFESEIVLNGLLAVSALHLTSLSPNPEPKLVAAQTQYMAKAIASNRAAVAQAGEGSREIFTAALFLFHYMWLAENRAALAGPYEIPTRPYQFARTVKLLWLSIPNYLDTWDFRLYCPPVDMVKASRPHHSHFIENSLLDLERLSAALAEWHYHSSEDHEALIDYHHALELAINTFSAPRPFPNAQNMLALLFLRSPHRYIELLEEKDPFAMALYGRNLTMIHLVDRIWWMHGLDGEELAAGNIRGIVSLMPKQHLWMMDWPISVIEGGTDLGL